MTTHIRDADPADAKALANLLAEVNDLHADALPDRFRAVPAGMDLEAMLRDQFGQTENTAFVALQTDAPVGYLLARLREAPPAPITVPRRFAEIDTLVVGSAVRGQGIGTALVRHAHRWAVTEGLDQMLLTVYEFNTPARGFYERLGYVTQRRTLWRSLADVPSLAPSAHHMPSPAATPADVPQHQPAVPTIDITAARPDDAVPLLKLQYLGYQSEAACYDDWSIPPLMETLSDMLHTVATDLVLVARLAEELVGSVRGHLRDGTCLVGRLVVHPRLRNLGIGSALMTEIESRFPDADRFALFTGHRSAANLRLYHRLGYAESHRETVSPRLQLVHLVKQRRQT